MALPLPTKETGAVLQVGVGLIPGGSQIVSGVQTLLGAGEKERIESHIQDRMKTYANYPDWQLNDIVRIYGGEMGEAARRVLSSRGKAPGAANIVYPDGSTAASKTGGGVPLTGTPALASLGGSNMIVIIAIVAAFLLLRSK